MELADTDIQNILSHPPSDVPPDKFEDDVCPPMSFLELDHLLQKLPLGKSSGYDQVPNEFLRNSSFLFKQYLLAFYNQIIKDGCVPESLNAGKCILIFKVIYTLKTLSFSLFIFFQGGDSLSPAQYRPITIPSNLLRVLTVRMCNLMTNMSELHGLIGEEQFGFRRTRSTLDAVFVLSTRIKKAKLKLDCLPLLS